MSIWETLKLDRPTKNEKEIKVAYAKLSKEIHPEENPEEFAKLHEAYKLAINYARKNKIPDESEIKHDNDNVQNNIYYNPEDTLKSNIYEKTKSNEDSETFSKLVKKYNYIKDFSSILKSIFVKLSNCFHGNIKYDYWSISPLGIEFLNILEGKTFSELIRELEFQEDIVEILTHGNIILCKDIENYFKQTCIKLLENCKLDDNFRNYLYEYPDEENV